MWHLLGQNFKSMYFYEINFMGPKKNLQKEQKVKERLETVLVVTGHSYLTKLLQRLPLMNCC